MTALSQANGSKGVKCQMGDFIWNKNPEEAINLWDVLYEI